MGLNMILVISQAPVVSFAGFLGRHGRGTRAACLRNPAKPCHLGLGLGFSIKGLGLGCLGLSLPYESLPQYTGPLVQMLVSAPMNPQPTYALE